MPFYADHGTYSAMTVAALQAYDKTIVGITVEWAQPQDFCLESTVGFDTYHLRATDFKPAPGSCLVPAQ